MSNKTCPTCKGTKKMEVVANILGDDGWKKAPPVMLDCNYCGGEGVITSERQAQIDYENSLWCKCEEDHDAYYVSDGVDEECDKHHWRCNNCKKITQIG